ncbi:hypothetical protein DFH06DRAFT_1223419 [Mycena polygramma]|nr:hypothetical protein DFH06DRAFT_1223419 [Mycena polygramma]
MLIRSQLVWAIGFAPAPWVVRYEVLKRVDSTRGARTRSLSLTATEHRGVPRGPSGLAKMGRTHRQRYRMRARGRLARRFDVSTPPRHTSEWGERRDKTWREGKRKSNAGAYLVLYLVPLHRHVLTICACLFLKNQQTALQFKCILGRPIEWREKRAWGRWRERLYVAVLASKFDVDRVDLLQFCNPRGEVTASWRQLLKNRRKRNLERLQASAASTLLVGLRVVESTSTYLMWVWQCLCVYARCRRHDIAGV